ncbi:glycosyltransferase [Streptosporangiaceae bacterium NEAU-GS5]|nr:glycosyltransferase [Streptosporangiaceae bacterium NEAU-GS5]
MTALSVIIPTRNERENVALVLDRLLACVDAVDDVDVEVIVVDDSDDDTPDQVAAYPVRIEHRPPADRIGGLGGAVMAGVRLARGRWILVMDGDLQHPPEVAIRLAKAAMESDADVVIGTRYAGRNTGLDGATRLFTAYSALGLAKALFPRRLAAVSDPLSGLFAFRRDAIDLDRMRPQGFAVLLDLLLRHPGLRIAEAGFAAGPRNAGRSKASFGQGVVFLRHLLRLRRHRLAGQLRHRTGGSRLRELGRMVAFGLVGLSGLGVNTAALWVLYDRLGLHHLLGVCLATIASTTWNFALTDAVLYRRGPGRAARFWRFALVNAGLLVPRLPVVEMLVRAGVNVYVANVVTLSALFLLRFLISDRVIYGADAQRRDPVRTLVDLGPPLASRTRYAYLPYRYDVWGLVRIGSQIMLPELEYFRAPRLGADQVDITVRVGDVGGRRPRHRATMTRHVGHDVLRYEEHLGRLGANFRLELGPVTDVVVGPLLAHSPHVVYTNIVEALLRFTLVSRGHMLLHSATVSLDGVGIMLSALTDTGKTATVLHLVRDHGAVFLSDDMTVIDASGRAYAFPKPLTISSHTLRAVQAEDLTPREWRRLRFQSRLHSKGGRSLALRLARFNLPIMGMNALVQMIVPPPKYSVDRLVPCRIGDSAQVTELFVIERGPSGETALDPADAMERLLRNTDDAYGFPPFSHLATALGYERLREQEREILSGFLAGVRGRVVASDRFGWSDAIRGHLTRL